MELLGTHGLIILAAGSLIGFLLGLLGGGGSLLAVPMLLHIGGITSPHMAIGTSAVAVAANALLNSIGHARRGHVAYRPALVFSLCGVAMAALGAWVGLGTPGPVLMMAFGGLTVTVGIWTAIRRPPVERAEAVSMTRVGAAGLLVGGMAGFFGIGGGFMAVPALLWATGLPMPTVIGTALVGVGVLGTGTALTYAMAGQVVWPVAGLLLAGGWVGGHLGGWLGRYTHARQKHLLRYMFSAFVILVGVYMMLQTVGHG